jgi:hypothetical protein
VTSPDVGGAYRRWAALEAHGISPLYEEWALGVASDEEVVDLIAELPVGKRQPNLVFAASRLHGAPEQNWHEFRAWLVGNWSTVKQAAMTRSTQTNEAGRCATLLPLLAGIPGPIALLEVGASAGLCLYPDRYSYRYRAAQGTHTIDPATGPSAVVLECDLVGEMPPTALPDIVWRAGLDLNPLDPASADDMAWLTALVWPEHGHRRSNLRAASRIAAAEPARLVKGDLVDDLPGLAAQAPRGATLVVFHSAVLAYIPAARRVEFADLLADLSATWISNEGFGVLPFVAQQLPGDLDADRKFVVSIDGHPVALAGGHGQSYETIGGSLADGGN